MKFRFNNHIYQLPEVLVTEICLFYIEIILITNKYWPFY